MSCNAASASRQVAPRAWLRSSRSFTRPANAPRGSTGPMGVLFRTSAADGFAVSSSTQRAATGLTRAAHKMAVVRRGIIVTVSAALETADLRMSARFVALFLALCQPGASSARIDYRMLTPANCTGHADHYRKVAGYTGCRGAGFKPGPAARRPDRWRAAPSRPCSPPLITQRRRASSCTPYWRKLVRKTDAVTSRWRWRCSRNNKKRHAGCQAPELLPQKPSTKNSMEIEISKQLI